MSAAAAVAVAALLFASVSICIYSQIVLSIFVFKTLKRNKDLAMFYARFVLDILYSFSIALNLAYFLLTLTGFKDFLDTHHNILFYVAWPNFNMSDVRALLVLAITLDRTIGAYMPIFYHNYRNKLSTSAIVMIIASYGLFEFIILFGFCGFTLQVPEDCFHFSCAINTCYREYWLSFDQVVYFLIGALSLALCTRLYIWNNCRNAKKTPDLSKANRLAVLDTFISFSFDLLPSFILSHFPLNFGSIGPINALGKTLGIMIEAIIVRMSLQKHRKVQPEKSTTQTVKVVMIS